MRTRLALAAAVIALLSPGVASAAESPAQQLATRYVPVLGFEPQQRPCGSGQVYRPTRVEVLLGHPEVELRGPDGRVVRHAPTGPELFGLGEGYYLDQRPSWCAGPGSVP